MKVSQLLNEADLFSKLCNYKYIAISGIKGKLFKSVVYLLRPKFEVTTGVLVLTDDLGFKYDYAEFYDVSVSDNSVILMSPDRSVTHYIVGLTEIDDESEYYGVLMSRYLNKLVSELTRTPDDLAPLPDSVVDYIDDLIIALKQQDYSVYRDTYNIIFHNTELVFKSTIHKESFSEYVNDPESIPVVDLSFYNDSLGLKVESTELTDLISLVAPELIRCLNLDDDGQSFRRRR